MGVSLSGSPQATLGMSAGSLGVTAGVWAEARGAARHPTRHGAAPPQTPTRAQMPVLPRPQARRQGQVQGTLRGEARAWLASPCSAPVPPLLPLPPCPKLRTQEHGGLCPSNCKGLKARPCRALLTDTWQPRKGLEQKQDAGEERSGGAEPMAGRGNTGAAGCGHTQAGSPSPGGPTAQHVVLPSPRSTLRFGEGTRGESEISLPRGGAAAGGSLGRSSGSLCVATPLASWLPEAPRETPGSQPRSTEAVTQPKHRGEDKMMCPDTPQADTRESSDTRPTLAWHTPTWFIGAWTSAWHSPCLGKRALVVSAGRVVPPPARFLRPRHSRCRRKNTGAGAALPPKS